MRQKRLLQDTQSRTYIKFQDVEDVKLKEKKFKMNDKINITQMFI